uniref:nucleoside-diphosphate kinase n=1 Tax=Pan troglodytes TaxID=9598 RepID=H2Q705_PANTR
MITPLHSTSRTTANLERTFITIRPDSMQCGLVGKIIKRFEQKGFRLVAMKFLPASEEHLKQHYIDLKDRPVFPGLVKYMTSGPVVAMVWEGLENISWKRANPSLMFCEREAVGRAFWKEGLVFGKVCRGPQNRG